MTKTINVFLPMRANSERIPQKNVKPFSGINGGLCKIKLEQLLRCRLIKNIFVSTNDPQVVEISNGLNSTRIKVILRPEELASSSSSTDDLIKYVPKIMPEGHILWTHVTSPFIDTHVYNQIIETYIKNSALHDSLMTVTKIQKFIWTKDGPINYDRSVEKWPRTQTINPLWEVNSGAFIATKKIYEDHVDRIGSSPYLFQLSGDISLDIDWPSDFEMADALYKRIFSKKSVSDQGV